MDDKQVAEAVRRVELLRRFTDSSKIRRSMPSNEFRWCNNRRLKERAFYAQVLLQRAGRLEDHWSAPELKRWVENEWMSVTNPDQKRIYDAALEAYYQWRDDQNDRS